MSCHNMRMGLVVWEALMSCVHYLVPIGRRDLLVRLASWHRRVWLGLVPACGTVSRQLDRGCCFLFRFRYRW